MESDYRKPPLKFTQILYESTENSLPDLQKKSHLISTQGNYKWSPSLSITHFGKDIMLAKNSSGKKFDFSHLVLGHFKIYWIECSTSALRYFTVAPFSSARKMFFSFGFIIWRTKLCSKIHIVFNVFLFRILFLNILLLIQLFFF